MMRAEWTKLAASRTFWASSALVLLSSIIVNAMSARSLAGAGYMSFYGEVAHSVTINLGIIVVMLQASYMVTKEYRFGTFSWTFLACPRRWRVALAKFLLYAAIAALLIFLSLLAGTATFDLLSPESGLWQDPAVLYRLWALPLLSIILVAFAQGLAYVLRSSGAMTALLIAWFFAIDNLLYALPGKVYGVAHFLPFRNFRQALNHADWMGWMIVLLWAAVIWTIGVAVLRRRDL